MRTTLIAQLRERADARLDEQKQTGERGERIAIYNLRCRNDARLMRDAATELSMAQGLLLELQAIVSECEEWHDARTSRVCELISRALAKTGANINLDDPLR